MHIRRNNALRVAVLAAFTSIADPELDDLFARFTVRDWRNLRSWLPASGLELYFLDELKSRRMETAIPGPILAEFEQHLADNRERTAALAREFVRLNSEFAAARFDYVCVKGFSLGAAYCKDPGLRSQFDLDFWLRGDHVSSCARLMTSLGYQVHPSGATLECHSSGPAYPHLKDFYKPPARKAVEIHLHSVAEFQSLPRSKGVLNTAIFPTLTPERVFIEQALHLTKHLRSEWTRASWMLELCKAVVQEEGGQVFWRGVREACPADHEVMVGIALAACARVFPFKIPAELNWALRALPFSVSRWIDEYAQAVTTAQFPGRKLYLLLDRELANSGFAPRIRPNSILLPLRLPGYIANGDRPGSVWNLGPHLKYAAMRFAFHVREGLRLLLIERRWRSQMVRTRKLAAREGGSLA